jgi:DbpA-like RNA binding protein
LTIEDGVTLDEARAALERGRHVVLVTPPEPEQAGAVWELVGPAGAARGGSTPGHGPGVGLPVLIVCLDDVCAVEWASAAPPDRRVHTVTSLSRAARLLKEGAAAVLAGALPDLTALVARAVLKLEAVRTVVLAWPEALVAGEDAAALDSLLAEAKDARRIILSWNPAVLRDFLERHAHRAHMEGAPPLDESARPLPPVGPARYVVVSPSRRPAALRDAIDVLDAARPYIWRGGPVQPAADQPDAVLCPLLPTREQFAALARLGEPVLLATAAQLPYVRSLARPLTPLRLPTPADRAQDRAAHLRERVDRILDEGNVDAELALLDPLFDRHDPAEVAAAILAISRQLAAVSETPPSNVPTWTKVFVNVGKKDRTAAKDLVGALIREVGIAKEAIGRIELRETFSLVEVTPAVAERVVRGLTGATIKGRRAVARLERGPSHTL